MDNEQAAAAATSHDLVAARLLDAAYAQPPLALFDFPLADVEPEKDRLVEPAAPTPQHELQI